MLQRGLVCLWPPLMIPRTRNVIGWLISSDGMMCIMQPEMTATENTAAACAVSALAQLWMGCASDVSSLLLQLGSRHAVTACCSCPLLGCHNWCKWLDHNARLTVWYTFICALHAGTRKSACRHTKSKDAKAQSSAAWRDLWCYVRVHPICCSGGSCSWQPYDPVMLQ